MNRLFTSVRLVSLAAAVSLLLGTGALAADTTKLNETDAPVKVSETVSGSALGIGTVTGSTVNVRENPNTDAAITAKLNNGAQVIVLSKEGRWYRISYNNIAGYVYAAYMTLNDTGESELGYAAIDENTLDVHAEADPDSDVIATITPDDVMEITGIYDGWYQVFVGGISGYVPSSQVNPTEELSAERIFGFAVVTSTAVNVRAEADASSEKVDMLYKGSRCELLAQVGDWYQISYNDTTGYVLSTYLSCTNDETEGSTTLETYNEAAAREKAEAEAAAAAAAAAAKAQAAAQTQTQSADASSSSSSSSGSSGSAASYTTENSGYSESASESTGSYNYSSSNSIVATAENYLGVPYVWGGTSPSGFDCSGFTQYVFSLCGYSISRTADAQYSCGSYVSYSNLQPGDLVFFAGTYGDSGITHVGIYIGDGEFIHSAGSGVKITSLSETYYATRYYGACRVA